MRCSSGTAAAGGGSDVTDPRVAPAPVLAWSARSDSIAGIDAAIARIWDAAAGAAGAVPAEGSEEPRVAARTSDALPFGNTAD